MVKTPQSIRGVTNGGASCPHTQKREGRQKMGKEERGGRKEKRRVKGKEIREKGRIV